ncbi:MAG: hypothetical protein JRJ44_00185 [Deltaproteobacteria bacterium]|nr:hypothetical protein [Deltaproteobacteria bacterium]
MKNLKPNCMPLLIGSLPIDDHKKASEIIFDYTPEIPLWAQLPAYQKEGMIEQFLPGMPSVTNKNKKTFINIKASDFEDEILKFYEDYINSRDKQIDSFSSRFTLTENEAKGFFVLMEKVKKLSDKPYAVKGQITGPVTFGIGVKDQDNKSIFYDERLKDIAVKLIAMKAKWQAGRLAKLTTSRVIIFLDEPALAGFGSSSFLTVSREEGMDALKEVIDAIHTEKALAGIHICANSDWSLVLETPADIISFDAYSFFDKFILYPNHIKKFIRKGGALAWGIIPTGNIEDIEKETSASLASAFKDKIAQIEKMGIEKNILLAQSYITPSCGTGNMSLKHAEKVLKMTKEVSEITRKMI